jgi:hypothetical protein
MWSALASSVAGRGDAGARNPSAACSPSTCASSVIQFSGAFVLPPDLQAWEKLYNSNRR